MRIQAVDNLMSFRANSTHKPVVPSTYENKNGTVQQFVTVGAGVAAIIGGLLIHKNIKLHKVEKAIVDSFAAKFPKDVEYRKEMLKAVGIPESKWFSIRSIIGGEEYKSIVKDFADSPEAYTPGKSLLTTAQDDYELSGVAQRIFRISLHNHTTKSDGKMSVAELLDQAAVYADKVAAENINRTDVVAKDAPFTIAITDHDTIDGCKEAVKIISANPEKYKNLRVVFGTELSVESKSLGNELIKPVPFHMVVNCINPFDKTLNEFLDGTKVARKNVAEKFFNEFTTELRKTQSKNVASRISMEEAREYSPTLKDGLNYPWYYMRQYVRTKLNPAEEKDVLAMFGRIQERFEPKLDLADYCMDMADAMNVVQEQKYGYMTIAHPALTPVGNCVRNCFETHKHLSSLISMFKYQGGERALAVEIYYPYFGNVAQSNAWLETISKATKDSKLLATGGLDSHGMNIFYSNY